MISNQDPTPTYVSSEPLDPTEHTLAANRAVLAQLALDEKDFERAARGLIATHPTGTIEHSYGTAWDIHRYDFIREQVDAPDTVNPSLWRQARLNSNHGLYEVADGLWQARGYDISNISFIQGKTGWIIIDPLTTEATAAACLELANATLGARPVVAVIYTHSHADHFGGAGGVVTREQVDNGDVRIIAPEGFLREAVSENVTAGMAMARRAAYQFGPLLPPGPRGHVDSGLGQAIPTAPSGLIAPTESISHTGQELDVDGVRIVFQNTPEAEAPAEMNFFFPGGGWLCMAENCSHNMHNLVPIRGAQVRDSLSWSKYIHEARDLFGEQTELMFASHHWPRWGQADVDRFLRQQRDVYRYIHDQTMRRANRGWTPLEIAEDIELPAEFQAESHTRGYYGALVHNVKAVYQRYLSWYDGNPARLNPHPPTEAGKRYVELAGGAEALLANARAAFANGDYRWVAEVVNHLVFADPDNTEGRQLQAAALEQLGYQTESSTFRNAYLTGAQELRNGPPPPRDIRRRDLMSALTMDQVFDLLGVRLQAEKLEGVVVNINWTFTDLDDTAEAVSVADAASGVGGQPAKWLLGIENQVLHYSSARHHPSPDATVTMTRRTLDQILQGSTSMVDEVTNGAISIDGDANALLTVFGNLETFVSGFPIVEP